MSAVERQEWRDWKAGVLYGRAVWHAGQPRPAVDDLVAFERGVGDGWDHAASHAPDSYERNLIAGDYREHRGELLAERTGSGRT